MVDFNVVQKRRTFIGSEKVEERCRSTKAWILANLRVSGGVGALIGLCVVESAWTLGNGHAPTSWRNDVIKKTTGRVDATLLKHLRVKDHDISRSSFPDRRKRHQKPRSPLIFKSSRSQGGCRSHKCEAQQSTEHLIANPSVPRRIKRITNLGGYRLWPDKESKPLSPFHPQRAAKSTRHPPKGQVQAIRRHRLKTDANVQIQICRCLCLSRHAVDGRCGDLIGFIQDRKLSWRLGTSEAC